MTPNIRDEWLDVELPPSAMATGCLPRTDLCGTRFTRLESVVPLIPRSEWDALAPHCEAMDQLIGRIHNQGSEGSCVGQGAGKSMEVLYALDSAEPIDLSAMSLYKRIGRSAGSGANISDALEEITTRGILPLDTPANREKYKHVHPETGFSRQLPSGWEETAKRFRVTEWWDIESFEGLMTVLLGPKRPVCYGRASHCICALRPVKTKGVWTVKYVNSWGNWGDNGCGYDSEGFLKARMGQYGAFSPRVTVVP